MSEWFIAQWPYFGAVLVATVSTVLVLRVTFLRLRELHLEIERLQLKNEHLSRELEEKGLTVFRPTVRITRFGLLGNLLPVLTLGVLVTVAIYSSIQWTNDRVKHSKQMDDRLRSQQDAFQNDIAHFKKEVERIKTVFRDTMTRKFQIELATGGQPKSPDNRNATRSGNIQLIEKKVIDIIADKLGVYADDVTREMSFRNDLDAYDVDLWDLEGTYEEEFRMQIPNEEAAKLRTVGDAIDYIAAHSELEEVVRFIFTLPTLKSPGK